MLEYQKDKVFLKIIPHVLSVEGGYVNDPKDPGGPTNRGIAWNYNSSILKRMGVVDIRNLTKEQATQIYYEKYWLPSKSNRIKDDRLALLHFDAAVNCGISQAGLFLSRLPKDKDPTYYIGNGANRAMFDDLFLNYLAQRMSFYTHAKGRAKYLEGWTNRLVHLVAVARGMA